MEGSGQVPFLLAERAHSESARSMRAVKGSLGHSPSVRWRESDGPRSGGRVRNGAPVGIALAVRMPALYLSFIL